MIFWVYTICIVWFSGSMVGYSFNKFIMFGDKKIRVKHTIFGKVYICVDDQVLMSEFNMLPKRHEFIINGNVVLEIDHFLKWHTLALGIDVRIDGKLIYSDK